MRAKTRSCVFLLEKKRVREAGKETQGPLMLTSCRPGSEATPKSPHPTGSHCERDASVRIAWKIFVKEIHTE